MKQILLFAVIGLSVWACKAKNQVQAEKVEEKVVADTHLQEPQQTEADLHLQRASQKLPDSLFARLQRTACFGRCPIYTLSIYESGYVDYIGEKWVDKEGRFKTKVEQAVLDEIMKKAKAINYFDLKAQYDSKYVNDLPSTITTLKGEEGFHVVVNRYQGPEEHSRFAQELDALFEAVEWEIVPIE
jgi:hypothetical protein